MGIYQGAGQGYPDTGMGMRGGYQGGFPASLNPDLPFYRGQPPPDYGGYQVSAHCPKVSQKQFNEFSDGREGDGICSISWEATVPPTTAGGLVNLRVAQPVAALQPGCEEMERE